MNKTASTIEPPASTAPAQPAPPPASWIRWLPLIITLLFAGWYAGKIRVPKDEGWPTAEIGHLPVVVGGRHMPLDSFARDVLVPLRNKQTVNYEPWKGAFDNPKMVSPMEWALEVMLNPELADTRPIIRIDNPEVRGFFGLPSESDPARQTDGKHFSWNQLQTRWDEFMAETTRISGKDEEKRTTYERAVMQLAGAVTNYRYLKITFGPAAKGDLAAGIAEFQAGIKRWREAVKASLNGESYERQDYGWGEEYRTKAALIAPRTGATGGKESIWNSAFDELIAIDLGQKGSPTLENYANMARTYRLGDQAGFAAAVKAQFDLIASKEGFAADMEKASRERLLSFAAPFFYGMYFAVAAALFAIAYWFNPGRLDWSRRTAVNLMILALVVETIGLYARYKIEGRPPVTTLYTSAIFIGWAAAIFGLLLEKVYPFSIGVVVASALGFCSLFIAHNLHIKDGTTFKILQPVLDTNFWLATHVVIVTLGYAATFFAGVLAIIYVIRSVTGGITVEIARALARMVYAIVCFATLFSFVGTILGGLWADQSWGRFWGWDVKENGAFMIVLWNAILLHARWGGLIRERGLMCLALGGNIVTAWSWFGVNNLAVGLHSYGFTEGAFKTLLAFALSQVALIALALVVCKPKVEIPAGGKELAAA